MPPAVPQSKTVNGSWAATFPENQESKGDSSLFMKRLLYVAFSQIMVYRKLVPRTCFKKRRCDNLRLFVFNTSVREAFKCADHLRAICETIDLGYLRELQLLVFDEAKNGEEVIESYKMGMSYGEDGKSPSVSIENGELSDRIEISYKGRDMLREQTRELLIRIHQITEKLADLPDTASWTFYILYVDERTPKGFQARTFNRRPEPYLVSPDAHRIVIGDASANHHACRFEVSSVFIEDPLEFEEMISGDLSAMKEGLRMSSADTTLDEVSPPKDANGNNKFGNLNDTFEDENAKEVEAPKEKARARGGGGIADLESAAEKMKLADRKEESSADKRSKKSPNKGEKSPAKVQSKSKVMKKTPGNVDKAKKGRT